MDTINALRALFTDHADPGAAMQMEAYQKGIAPFLGINTPKRRALQKAFWQEHGRPSVEAFSAFATELFALPEREYHYAAVELCYDLRKGWRGTELPLFEQLIQTHSWWDTVDTIAVKLVGTFLQRFPEQKGRVADYIRSGNMWLRRTAIIFQNSYKERTDEALLFAAIRPHLAEKEFFIRKAIGWALREYAKTAPDAVRQFVAAHPLSPLSRREALKHLG